MPRDVKTIIIRTAPRNDFNSEVLRVIAAEETRGWKPVDWGATSDAKSAWAWRIAFVRSHPRAGTRGVRGHISRKSRKLGEEKFIHGGYL